jgi:hypothetical protein
MCSRIYCSLGLCKYTVWRSHNDEITYRCISQNVSPSLSDACLYWVIFSVYNTLYKYVRGPRDAAETLIKAVIRIIVSSIKTDGRALAYRISPAQVLSSRVGVWEVWVVTHFRRSGHFPLKREWKTGKWKWTGAKRLDVKLLMQNHNKLRNNSWQHFQLITML